MSGKIKSFAVKYLCVVLFLVSMSGCFVEAATLTSNQIRNYVLQKVNQSYPSGYCLKFVEEIYQSLGATRPYNCCASKSGNNYIKSTSSSNIPVGATVYFGNCGGGPCKTCGSSYYGHVGIYVGDGYFIHASGGKINKSTLNSWSNKYRGWGYCGNFYLDASEQDSCNCSTNYAGNYIVNTSSLPLNIRSSHSASGAVIGSIPKGSKVYVSKADGTWAHVTYGNISGYCSMQYLKKETIDRNIKVQCWFSNTGMGDEISNCKTGEKIYFCYKIYDDATGKLWNELEDCNYQVKEIVYNPDGSVHGSFTYENSDNNWIAFTPDVEGEYKGRIELTGDRTGSVEFSINAKMITIRLHGWFSDSKMGDEIETVNVGESLFLCYELFDVETGKPWNEIENVDYHVKAYICDPSGKDVGCRMFDNVDSDWCHVKPSDTGTYTGRVEITGARSGDIEIEITVNQNYAITYDVNGGNFSAPEKQIKKNDTNIVIEDYAGQYYDSIMLYGNGGVFGNDETSHMCTLVRPFLNWNTKSDGTGLVVNAGSIYGKNEDLALYAQYKALGQISIIPVFEREGYKLINWNTKADGSGISYEITDSIPIGTSLYAQWEYEMKPTEKPLVTPKPAVSETPATSIPQESETPSTSQPQESGTPVIIKPIASDLPSVLPEKGMLGDVDLDKDVDLVDAQIVLKIALGIVERADSLNIDIDDNLIINLKDAQIILKAALGICLLQ